MAEVDQLTELGLGVTDTETGLEAVLQLGTPLLNPLARRPIATGVFALAEQRLIPLEPAELVGLPPLSLDGVRNRSELEQQLAGAFHTHLVTLQRRSSELRALGCAPQVDPETLELAARVEDPPFRFLLAGDKRGQLRVVEVTRDGGEARTDVGAPFDLSDFPNRAGLFAHLRALVGPPSSAVSPSHTVRPVGYRELLEHFGETAWIPPTATVDVVVTLRAQGTLYRFAATRIRERTFRALLAGPGGKVWADQFDLESFPGVAAVVAVALGVPASEVEVLASWEEG
ncbi:MAG: hypothetical protein ACLPJH_01265 [Myxococcaceae bacterium]